MSLGDRCCKLFGCISKDRNGWWSTEKLSDNWLDKIFTEFFKSLNITKSFFKRDYYQLISLLSPNEVDDEIVTKLDMLHEILQ